MLRIYRPEPEPTAEPETPQAASLLGLRCPMGRPLLTAYDPSRDAFLFPEVGMEWHCDGDGAENVAEWMTFEAGVIGGDLEAVEELAREVVLKLPRDRWEVAMPDVRRWYEEWLERRENEGLIWEREAEEE